jgi:CDP-diacylglycerol--glycerol-3-phosphate 3-phosphatidyltransferase
VPLTLPNVLTLLRVAAIPLLVALFYMHPPIATLGTAGLFTLASVTDWIDGWLARRTGQTTAFGAFLDPVADKLIVATSLVLLVDRYESVIVTLAACVIIGREIVVSAMREWMAQVGQSAAVKVSQLAKVKTALQMTAIVLMLLIIPDASNWHWSWLAQLVLVGAVGLTLASMVIYLKAFWRVLGNQGS